LDSKFYLLGDFGSNACGEDSVALYDISLKIQIELITFILGPPPEGATLKVIDAQHSGTFRTMTLKFKEETEEIQEYSRAFEKSIEELNQCIDWQKIFLLRHENYGTRI
jgi:hypothetical protein